MSTRGRHDVADGLAAELQDFLKHVFVFLFLHVGDLKRVRQVVERQTLFFLGHDSVDNNRAACHQRRQRTQHVRQRAYTAHSKNCPFQAMLVAVELGEDFAEEKQDKREQH